MISSWPEAERARAHAAIAEIEAQALADMKARAAGPPCWAPAWPSACTHAAAAASRRAHHRGTVTRTRARTPARAQLMPGLHELCAALDAARVPRGLITRNVKSSIEYFHERHFLGLDLPAFEPAISRECAFPYVGGRAAARRPGRLQLRLMRRVPQLAALPFPSPLRALLHRAHRPPALRPPRRSRAPPRCCTSASRGACRPASA